MAATLLDFWRMVWQTKSSVVVLLSQLEDSKTNRDASIVFWPPTGDHQYMDKERKLQVKTLTSTYGPGYDEYGIEVQRGGRYHKFTLIQYHQWRDDERIPDDLVKFVATCTFLNSNYVKKSPTIVICRDVSQSSKFWRAQGRKYSFQGFSRSATFAALDICIRRLNKENKVNVEDTAISVCIQRYGSLRSSNHFLFIHKAVVNHAIEHGDLDGVALGNHLDISTFNIAMRPPKRPKA